MYNVSGKKSRTLEATHVAFIDIPIPWITERIAILLEGDAPQREKAQRELAEKLWPVVLGMAVNQCRMHTSIRHDPHIAVEAADSALMTLLNKAHQLHAPEGVMAWLRTIIRNQLINAGMARNKNLAREMLVDESWPFDRAAIYDRSSVLSAASVLRNAVRGLSEEDRLLIYWRYWGDQGWTAIGRMLGITRQSATRRNARILGILRETLLLNGYTDWDERASTGSS